MNQIICIGISEHKKLQWLPFRILVVTYKVLHAMQPGCLRYHSSPIESAWMIWFGRLGTLRSLQLTISLIRILESHYLCTSASPLEWGFPWNPNVPHLRSRCPRPCWCFKRAWRPSSYPRLLARVNEAPLNCVGLFPSFFVPVSSSHLCHLLFFYFCFLHFLKLFFLVSCQELDSI